MKVLHRARSNRPRRRRGFSILGRGTTLAFVIVLATATIALADTPNPSGTVTRLAGQTGSTLTVSGTWSWPGHNKCDKFTGWAVDWNDSAQPGNPVGSAQVGVAAPITGNALNPVDNAVHFDSSQCGPTGTWGPLTHTYTTATTSVSVCVVTYDVHSGDVGKSGGHGTVAGGPNRNDDNSMDENGLCLASTTFKVINDRDNDTIPDETDNCPDTPNTNQKNVDGDSKGDLCDTEGPSGNTNGIVTTGNPTGDDCKDTVDNDGDGKTDGAEPTCDRDNDTIPDGTDNCPDTPNTNQKNVDGDSKGDLCDTEGPPGNTNGIKTTANPSGDDCKDNVDNDGDGKTDGLDTGCGAAPVGPTGQSGLGTPCVSPTLVGGAGDSLLIGTPGNDVILDLLGSNHVEGRGGNDTICTGPGNDVVLTLNGSDLVWDQGGQNLIRTAGGSDTVQIVRAGSSRIATGIGRDNVTVTGAGNNNIRLGKGRDRAKATSSRDLIKGGAGRDRIAAGDGKNRLGGGRGNDKLRAGRGRDRLNGSKGKDTCRADGGKNKFRNCEIRRGNGA